MSDPYTVHAHALVWSQPTVARPDVAADDVIGQLRRIQAEESRWDASGSYARKGGSVRYALAYLAGRTGAVRFLP